MLAGSNAIGTPANTYSSTSTNVQRTWILLPTLGMGSELYQRLHFMQSQEYDLDALICLITSSLITIVGEIDNPRYYHMVYDSILDDLWSITSDHNVTRQYSDYDTPTYPFVYDEHDYTILSGTIEVAIRQIATAVYHTLTHPLLHQRAQFLTNTGYMPQTPFFEEYMEDFRVVLSEYFSERYIGSWLYNRDQVLVEFVDLSSLEPHLYDLRT